MTNNPQNVQSYTLPPPVGGLDFVSSIDNMPPQNTRAMLNVFPENSSGVLRAGCTLHSTISGGNQIERLYSLVLADGSEKLLAAVNNTFQEVTTSTPAARTGTTTPTSNAWQGHVFRNRLFLVNGTNTPQVWTGTGNVSDVTITGVTSSNLINVSSYKSRLYFVEKDTAKIWYTDEANDLSGTVLDFDLGGILQRGGCLVFAGSFTNRLAESSRDLFVAVSSEGEVLCYAGSDPTTWALVARFVIGKPLGYRAYCYYDADLLILTKRGIVPISGLFRGEVPGRDGIGAAVNPYIREISKSAAVTLPWNLHYFAEGKKLIVNIPLSAVDCDQLVCNVDTGSWCRYRYSNTAPLNWASINSKLYFAGVDGTVYEAENGTDDDGEPIQVDLLWAWNAFSQRSRFKRFVDARPLFIGNKITELGIRVESDFFETSLTSVPTVTNVTTTPWGSPWGSSWGGATMISNKRYSVSNQGHFGALRIFGAFKGVKLKINSTEIRYEIGGQV